MNDATLQLLKDARRSIGDFLDVTYGKNMLVEGWHLNGALEPLDSFIDDNIDLDLIERLDAAILDEESRRNPYYRSLKPGEQE